MMESPICVCAFMNLGHTILPDASMTSPSFASLEISMMLFSSSIFLFLFLPIVIIFYYNPFVKNRIYRNVILLLASLFFYAWGEPVFVLLMMLSVFINWFIGLRMDKAEKKKSWLVFVNKPSLAK